MDDTCPKCGGSGGGDEPALRCGACGGTGSVAAFYVRMDDAEAELNAAVCVDALEAAAAAFAEQERYRMAAECRVLAAWAADILGALYRGEARRGDGE